MILMHLCVRQPRRLLDWCNEEKRKKIPLYMLSTRGERAGARDDDQTYVISHVDLEMNK